jgi:tetratricopeptide (TPR) repeat protein
MDWDKYGNAIALHETGRTQEAILQLQSLEGTSSDPEENALVFLAIANCLRQRSKLHEAQLSLNNAFSVLTKASKLYPRVLFVEALLHEAKGDWKGELERLNYVSEQFAPLLQEDEHEDLRGEVSRHRGIALLGLGRYREAQPLLEAGALDDYEKEVTLYFLGQCYFQLGDLRSAKQRMREALQIGLHPKHELTAHYRLAVIHFQLGEYAWSKNEFEWCLAHLDQGTLARTDILKGLESADKAMAGTRGSN